MRSNDAAACEIYSAVDDKGKLLPRTPVAVRFFSEEDQLACFSKLKEICANEGRDLIVISAEVKK